jgi:uncharacterized protein (TIGR00369 family)
MIEYFKSLIGKESKHTSPSPYGRWLNGKLLSAETGKLSVEVFLREDFGNPGGILHGGVISGIIDEVIGMTTFTLGREGFFVAINLNVDFLRPGKIGETIRVESEIIRAGKTMAHAECKVFDLQNKLIAKASSNLALTNR